MTRATVPQLPDEELRLRQRAPGPIQLPVAIQPHGAVVAVDGATLEILQVSENTADILGIGASSLLKTNAAHLVDAQTEAFLRSAFAADATSPTKSFAAEVNGRTVDIVTHLVEDVGVIEFEPAIPLADGRTYISAIHEASQRLARASDAGELRLMAAHELRQLTQFDQVMAYHFHPDGHGEVLADDHVAGMTSYLGLHFPASDVPAQARRLHQLKGSGLIATSDYRPAVLLPMNNPRTGSPLDLSRAELRSVSPHHLQLMRNMGQSASFTLPLFVDDQMLGLITCAHRTPRRIPFDLRRMCEVLVQQVVLQLHAMMRAEKVALQFHGRDVRALLVEQMKLDHDIVGGLTGETATIQDLIPADGAAVFLDHRCSRVGDSPSSTQTMALITALLREDGSVSPLLSDSLARDRPALAELVPAFAGVFVLPFGRAGDCLVWFRRELAQSVDWLGAHSLEDRSTPLSPPTSFDRWREEVTNRSAPWDDVGVAEASELARDIDQILLHRIDAQLAHMATHDSLTGLPNRHLLIDRITTALARAARNGGQVVILFCDLDDFKRVNDTGGHAAGDAVLIEAAGRLQLALRAYDSVARVGGDEFVAVLEPVAAHDPTPARLDVSSSDCADVAAETEIEPADPRQAAIRIAERIKTELSRPISYHGQEYVISVSVGITFAEPGSPAEDLVRDADTAMYRAKQTGKSCVVIFDEIADLVLGSDD
jgi:two-component system, chemotaxis family, sensor kinase Cph1